MMFRCLRCSLFKTIPVFRRSSGVVPHSASLVHLPIVISNTGAGERAYDIYSRLLEDRIVCLMGPVNTDVAGLIIAQLLYLQSENAQKPINMYINSPGGEVMAGMGIYDTMQHVRPPIATWCVGEACSMGSFLLAAGTPGMRHALPHSRIMVHQPLGGTQGQVSDMQIHMKEIQRLKELLNSLYSKHTKQPVDVIERAVERDHFMTSQQALEFGLIDKVLAAEDKAT